MTSKWIKELNSKSFYFERDDSGEFDAVLERIDKLLRQAMYDTDNESLHDDIREELKNESS